MNPEYWLIFGAIGVLAFAISKSSRQADTRVIVQRPLMSYPGAHHAVGRRWHYRRP